MFGEKFLGPSPKPGRGAFTRKAKKLGLVEQTDGLERTILKVK